MFWRSTGQDQGYCKVRCSISAVCANTGLSERLFSQLETSTKNERHEVKLMMTNFISRLVGIHQVYVAVLLMILLLFLLVSAYLDTCSQAHRVTSQATSHVCQFCMSIHALFHTEFCVCRISEFHVIFSFRVPFCLSVCFILLCESWKEVFGLNFYFHVNIIFCVWFAVVFGKLLPIHCKEVYRPTSTRSAQRSLFLN